MKYNVRISLFILALLVVAVFLLVNSATLFYVSKEDSKRPELKRKQYGSDNVVDMGVEKTPYRSQNSQGARDWDSKGDKDRSRESRMKDPVVDELLTMLDKGSDRKFNIEELMSYNYLTFAKDFGKKARRNAPILAGYRNVQITKTTPNYQRFHMGIRKHSMYDPDSPAIDGLLRDMEMKPFKTVDMMKKGTELKLLIGFPDGNLAVFKPMRWPRDHETLPNHFYFNDYERHNAEIAAFHLDRVLAFYRVPPVTGRFVNMTSEIYALAEKALRKTFYVSPAANLCFYGECTYYCDSRHSFCGTGDIIEGSLMVFLPPDNVGQRMRWKSPYRRSYSKLRKADWEVNDNYCDAVKRQSPYNKGRFLVDIIDMHIFDFLTGNMDRHHVEIFEQFGNESFLIHLDNGRGFGKTKHDEHSIITPLRQCCVIRESTFLKLVKLYIGPETLSSLLDKSLQQDPLYPILTEAHLEALDRRLVHVLHTVADCIDRAKSTDSVIIHDQY